MRLALGPVGDKLLVLWCVYVCVCVCVCGEGRGKGGTSGEIGEEVQVCG